VTVDRPASVRVAIVDDHQMFAESLSHVLALEPDLEVVGVARDGAAAMDLIADARPDVALVDFRLPGQDGVAVTAAIKELHPDVHVIMLTAMREEQVLVDAIDAGVSGFLTKDHPVGDVAGAVRTAAAGEALISPDVLARVMSRLRRSEPQASFDLTARERELLEHVAQGGTNKAIARELHLSVNTIRNYVQALLTKLGAHSKLEAVAIATRAGLIDAPSRR
jgi:DNA-binding NarL/FixJ family response regulator